MKKAAEVAPSIGFAQGPQVDSMRDFAPPVGRSMLQDASNRAAGQMQNSRAPAPQYDEGTPMEFSDQNRRAQSMQLPKSNRGFWSDVSSFRQQASQAQPQPQYQEELPQEPLRQVPQAKAWAPANFPTASSNSSYMSVPGQENNYQQDQFRRQPNQDSQRQMDQSRRQAPQEMQSFRGQAPRQQPQGFRRPAPMPQRRQPQFNRSNQNRGGF